MADPERAPRPPPDGESNPAHRPADPLAWIDGLRLPRLPGYEATPRFLEVIETMLADPGRIGAAGLRAAIETLLSRDQIQDPLPSHPCRNYERRFSEGDEMLGGTAFYLLRVQRLLGNEEVVTAVSLLLESLALPNGAVVDRDRLERIAAETGQDEGVALQIVGGASLRLDRTILDSADCFLSSNSLSTVGGMALKALDNRSWYRPDRLEARAHRVGSFFGSAIVVHSSPGDMPVQAKLLDCLEEGTPRLLVENRSGGPLWLFLLKPLPGG